MATGDLCPGTVCRSGDTVSVRVPQGDDGSWTYEARILWLRDGHVGLTPPMDHRWQQFLVPGKILWMVVRHDGVSARLRLQTVGLTADLPPVLVVRQVVSPVAARPDSQRPAAAAAPPLRPGPG